MNTLTEVILLIQGEADRAHDSRSGARHTRLAKQLVDLRARDAGRILGAPFFRDSLIYTSPFAADTLDTAIIGAGLEPMSIKICEDHDLAEDDIDADETAPAEPRRAWFRRRPRSGESSAHCYTRVGLFLSTLHRQAEQSGARSVLVCTHGLTARCLVMRWLKLKQKQFDSLENPMHCDIIRIGLSSRLSDPQFVCDRWGVIGLRHRKDQA